MEGIKITTESGFECKVRENAMNDMRILDALIKVESRKVDYGTKVVKLTYILDTLLGEDQTEDLYDFVAEREGQAKIESVFAILKEIFSAVNEGKKK